MWNLKATASHLNSISYLRVMLSKILISSLLEHMSSKLIYWFIFEYSSSPVKRLGTLLTYMPILGRRFTEYFIL